jgi:hypothetical protein
MGFSDRLRAWFKGETKQRAPAPATDPATRATTRDLEDFITSRTGVEAYLEPRTATYPTQLLLVADDGEHLRRSVKDPDHARALCSRRNVPLYDVRKVGYPRRVKDYERGVRPDRIDLADLPPWPGDDLPGDDGPEGRSGHDPGGPPPPPPAAR